MSTFIHHHRSYRGTTNRLCSHLHFNLLAHLLSVNQPFRVTFQSPSNNNTRAFPFRTTQQQFLVRFKLTVSMFFVKYDEVRKRKIWFNSMVAAYTGWKDERNDPVKAVTFVDGSPLPADVVYDCLNILEEEYVAIPWRKGDVMLLDNWAVLHSRRPFDPPRRVLASLVK